MNTVQKLNSKDFDKVSRDNSRLNLVKFGAEWCGPCRAIRPILESLAKNHQDLNVYDVDVERDPELSRQFGVRGIPMVLFFKDGKVVDSFTGLRGEKEIEEIIKRLS